MKNLLRSKNVLFGVVGLAVAALLVACGGAGQDEQAASDPVAETERQQALGLFDKLPVSWAPSPLVFTLNPGSLQRVPVTLTTKKALNNARIVFVPDLRNAVTVTPEVIPTLAAGQSATVTLTFAPKATDTRKVIAGVVLLFDKNATVSAPLPVKVSLVKAETINGVVVPPEPPANLNNATLAGFDVNGNGVRDDVERYIATEYPSSARTRSSVTQRAGALQKVLLSSDHSSTKQLLDAARDCMAATFGTSSSDADGARRARASAIALSARMLNTADRIRAYAVYDQTRSGTMTLLTPYANSSSKCLVNPASLSN
jgi:hypothetical protein